MGDIILTLEMIRKAMERYNAANKSTIPSPPVAEAENEVIRLNCDFSLMPLLEKFCDIKAGEAYFINQIPCLRVNYLVNNTTGQSNSIHNTNDSPDDDDTTKINGENSGKSIALPNLTPPPMAEVVEANNTLVLAICKTCNKYMMVAKASKPCPTCGRALLQLCPRCDGPLRQFTNERCSQVR